MGTHVEEDEENATAEQREGEQRRGSGAARSTNKRGETENIRHR